MRRTALLVCTLVGCAARPAPAPTPAASSTWAAVSAPAWAEFTRRISGSFKADLGDGKFIRIVNRPVSGGSAVVETFTSSGGGETLTVYHPDGAHLMLTHYCGQGNQARLKAVEVAPEKWLFQFLDATNVAADQGVMRERLVTFTGDGFELREVYREPDGKDGADTLHFVREPG